MDHNHYLKIILNGTGKNTLAIGAKVTLIANGEIFFQELNPTRGFQSSVDTRLNFGLGDITIIDNDEIHHYQPGWLFIPFGVYSAQDCQKPKREFMQRPENRQCVLSDLYT